MRTGLIDTHCHLFLSQFDGDRHEVIRRAEQAGVEAMLVAGIDLASSQQAVELAQQSPRIFASVGVHPHSASSWDSHSRSHLRDLATSDKVVAIGEIGLDYYRRLSPERDQRRAFQAQLDLAADMELPVVVHIRDALLEILRSLAEWVGNLPQTLAKRAGVLHAYSGDVERAEQAVAFGFYLGVAGPITYQNAQQRRQITQELPLDRLLLETDAPYLAPHPYRGQRNEPAHVRLVAESLAQVKGMDLETLAERTSLNAAALFGWNHETRRRNLL